MSQLRALFLALVATPVYLFATDNNGTPDGNRADKPTEAIILDAKTKLPLAGVTVLIKNLNDNSVVRVTTDEQGKVVLSNMEVAEVQIVVEKNGYKKLETKAKAKSGQLIYNLTKQDEFIHPFIRFR